MCSSCCVSVTGGFHRAGCIHFLLIRSLVPAIFSWDGGVGESSCIPFDVYPNRSVQYLHEHCLLERGNASPWMDDPPEPEPQNKHLCRISPSTRLAYAARYGCHASS